MRTVDVVSDAHGTTADCFRSPHELLRPTTARIINEVRGIKPVGSGIEPCSLSSTASRAVTIRIGRAVPAARANIASRGDP